MKKTFTFLILVLLLLSIVEAQTTLDPNLFVNEQITGDGVYTVEAGQFYAFDGRIDLIHDITIQGPDEGWIMNVAAPAVLLQTPAADGSRRDFFEIKEGGALTLKNVIMSGTHSNGEVGRVFINNTGGSKYIIDNCVITDWEDFALRNQNTTADSISVTNCVFINGMRQRYSQWGGFPVRLDVSPDNMIFENNTVYNSGRLLANSGPFHNANVHQIHNTYLNQAVAGEEQRAKEFITANNIFYNFHFLGYRNENHSTPDNNYGSYFTTWNYFADSKEKLDSISLYLGQNLFYRPEPIVDWFETSSGDSIDLSLLWEHADVDSFILMDDNYRIGANYAELNPGFTTLVDNTDQIINYINSHYNIPSDVWHDWRIVQTISFDPTTGAPSLSWPPPFDLSYSNTAMQAAGTDGLALGDLNWFPDMKAEYLANRDAYIADLRDSMVNAQIYYDPETMESTPLITELPSSVNELIDPSKLYLSGNYPNPFNQVTTIKFGLEQQSQVTLSVYDQLGQKIYESSKGSLAPGTHEFDFNGAGLSSGIYFCKLNAVSKSGQNYAASKKMILTK